MTDQAIQPAEHMKVRGGLVVLYHSFLPSLACSIVDLGLDGIKCRLPAERSGEIVVATWRTAMEAGAELEVEIVAPLRPHRISSELRKREIVRDETLCSLSFNALDESSKTLIDNAIKFFQGKTAEAAHPHADPAQPRAGLRKWTAAFVHGLREHFSHSDRTDFHTLRLGDILVELGCVSKVRMEAAVWQAEAQKLKLGRYLVKEGIITQRELVRALSLQTGMPIVNLSSVNKPASVRGYFNSKVFSENHVVPFNECGNTVYAACSEKVEPSVVEALQHQTHHHVKLFLTDEEALDAFLSKD